MSVEGDLFRVTVKGSRESVVKMMNAVLKSFNSDNVIAESDDVETMNSKLELLRASFAPYNTMEEAEYFVNALETAIKMLI